MLEGPGYGFMNRRSPRTNPANALPSNEPRLTTPYRTPSTVRAGRTENLHYSESVIEKAQKKKNTAYLFPQANFVLFWALVPFILHPFIRYVVSIFTELLSAKTSLSAGSPLRLNWNSSRVTAHRSAVTFDSFLLDKPSRLRVRESVATETEVSKCVASLSASSSKYMSGVLSKAASVRTRQAGPSTLANVIVTSDQSEHWATSRLAECNERANEVKPKLIAEVYYVSVIGPRSP